MSAISRRQVIRTLRATGILVAAPAIIRIHSATAADDDTLARVRKAGVVKVGMANQPPYSGVTADGSMVGICPAVVQKIMPRLGVPKVEPVIGTYAQAIPGLLAGRWDMVAGLNQTKERCSQVSFSAPIMFDGHSISYVPKNLPNAPNSMAGLASPNITVGIATGSWALGKLLKAGVQEAKVAQIPDIPALIEALLANRIQAVFNAYAAVNEIRKARSNAFEINFPLTDDAVAGANAAFRPADQSFVAAFEEELSKMKKSGEFEQIANQNGFKVLPGQLEFTAAQGCA